MQYRPDGQPPSDVGRGFDSRMGTMAEPSTSQLTPPPYDPDCRTCRYFDDEGVRCLRNLDEPWSLQADFDALGTSECGAYERADGVDAMRDACRQCGHWQGWVSEVNGQRVVRCWNCLAYCYCEPRKKRLALASRPGITPGRRARLFAIHDHACIACGRRPPEVRLELDHLISRAEAEGAGLLDDLIDSDHNHNLAPMCAECNSGKRVLKEPAVRLLYRALLLKSKAPQ